MVPAWAFQKEIWKEVAYIIDEKHFDEDSFIPAIYLLSIVADNRFQKAMKKLQKIRMDDQKRHLLNL